MRSQELTSALAVDPHFPDAGFKLLPPICRVRGAVAESATRNALRHVGGRCYRRRIRTELAENAAACDSQPLRLMATLTRRVEVLEEKMEGLADLPARMTRVEQELRTLRTEMRQEIRAGDEETRRYMRVLNEDVIDRLKLIGEGVDAVNRGSKRRRSPRREE